MIKYIFYVTAILGLASCEYKKESNPVSPHTEAQINNEFEITDNSIKTKSLEEIFLEWNNKIIPNTDDFINQNDTINALFKVYKEFYNPLDMSKLGSWEWGNKLNLNSKYVVIKNRIYYIVLPSDSLDGYDWQTLKTDSIENFRPPVNLEKNKVLYLTAEYENFIYNFLGQHYQKLEII